MPRPPRRSTRWRVSIFPGRGEGKGGSQREAAAAVQCGVDARHQSPALPGAAGARGRRTTGLVSRTSHVSVVECGVVKRI